MNKSEENCQTMADGKTAVEKYKDIIYLSRPASKYPHMSVLNRAKIFAPYDALRGFDEEIEKVDRKRGK